MQHLDVVHLGVGMCMEVEVGWWECKVEHCARSALVQGLTVVVLHIEAGSVLPQEIVGQDGVGH